MEFALATGYYVYRPLKKDMQGWDVFALQTGLAGTPGYDNLVADGFFGLKTDTAIKNFQEARDLTKDGIAGIATQRKLCTVLGRKFNNGWNLPAGVPFGHIEQECGCQIGNHTSVYPNGSRDCGIVQRNTTYTDIQEGFDAPASLMALCERVSSYWDRYQGMGVPSDRALELACGSWNAPAWTDRLARGETLTEAQRSHIETYIAKVTKYVV